jgi:hypothetical protein
MNVAHMLAACVQDAAYYLCPNSPTHPRPLIPEPHSPHNLSQHSVTHPTPFSLKSKCTQPHSPHTNASYTPSSVPPWSFLADVSLYKQPCSRAKAAPSSGLTARTPSPCTRTHADKHQTSFRLSWISWLVQHRQMHTRSLHNPADTRTQADTHLIR